MTARAAFAALFVLVSGAIAASAHPVQDVGATILCYHIVESPQDPRMEISREAFRQQMRYLAMTDYTVIPLRELYEYAAGKRASLPRNAIVITIDDGWRSTYTDVFPEMKRLGFPFTVFIYPRIIGQTNHFMTWKQIREMADAGVDIESHSLSHPFLTQRRHSGWSPREYAAWLEHELGDSKRILERETGKPVTFLAYPYGDYDHRLAAKVAEAGYTAALTCDYGRVRRGSDPLRMKRVAIEKAMDFAMFRRLLGASPMQLAHMTPQPGHVLDDPSQTNVTVSARIPNYRSLDPKSVGLALLSMGGTFPYTYDPRDGSISLTIREALKGTVQRALVWATDQKSGKRLEASWTFRLPGEELLPIRKASVTIPPQVAPAQLLQPLASSAASVQGGGSGSGNAAHAQVQRAPR